MAEESVGDAGASSLGYFGGVWGPVGDAILAHGYTGALHLWRRQGMESARVTQICKPQSLPSTVLAILQAAISIRKLCTCPQTCKISLAYLLAEPLSIRFAS